MSKPGLLAGEPLEWTLADIERHLGAESAAAVRRDVMAGASSALGIYDRDGVRRGSIVCARKPRTLHVEEFAGDGDGQDLLELAHQAVTNLAAALGCDRVVCETVRAGMVRACTARGWTITDTIGPVTCLKFTIPAGRPLPEGGRGVGACSAPEDSPVNMVNFRSEVPR